MLNSTSVNEQPSTTANNNNNQRNDDEDNESFMSKTSSYIKRNMKVKSARRAIGFIILLVLGFNTPIFNNSMGDIFAKIDNMTAVCGRLVMPNVVSSGV